MKLNGVEAKVVKRSQVVTAVNASIELRASKLHLSGSGSHHVYNALDGARIYLEHECSLTVTGLPVFVDVRWGAKVVTSTNISVIGAGSGSITVRSTSPECAVLVKNPGGSVCIQDAIVPEAVGVRVDLRECTVHRVQSSGVLEVHGGVLSLRKISARSLRLHAGAKVTSSGKHFSYVPFESVTTDETCALLHNGKVYEILNTMSVLDFSVESRRAVIAFHCRRKVGNRYRNTGFVDLGCFFGTFDEFESKAVNEEKEHYTKLLIPFLRSWVSSAHKLFPELYRTCK